MNEAQNEDAKQTLPSPAALIVRAPNCHADQNETHHHRHSDDDKPATKFHKNKWNCMELCLSLQNQKWLYHPISIYIGHVGTQHRPAAASEKRILLIVETLQKIFAVTKHSYLTYSYHVSICILSCIILHGTSNGSASGLPASHHGCLFHCGPNQEELAIDAIQLMLAGENSRFRKGAVCLGNKTPTPQIKEWVHQIIACKFISQVGCAWRLIRKKKAKRYNTSPWSNNQDFCLCRNDKTHR